MSYSGGDYACPEWSYGYIPDTFCGQCGQEIDDDKAHCSPECESQWALMLEKAKAGTLEPEGGMVDG